MVFSGLLTWRVYELLKEASGKCSGGSDMPYFTQQETVRDKTWSWVFLWDIPVSVEDVDLKHEAWLLSGMKVRDLVTWHLLLLRTKC